MRGSRTVSTNRPAGNLPRNRRPVGLYRRVLFSNLPACFPVAWPPTCGRSRQKVAGRPRRPAQRRFSLGLKLGLHAGCAARNAPRQRGYAIRETGARQFVPDNDCNVTVLRGRLPAKATMHRFHLSQRRQQSSREFDPTRQLLFCRLLQYTHTLSRSPGKN